MKAVRARKEDWETGTLPWHKGMWEWGGLTGHQSLMANQPFCGKAEIKG